MGAAFSGLECVHSCEVIWGFQGSREVLRCVMGINVWEMAVAFKW